MLTQNTVLSSCSFFVVSICLFTSLIEILDARFQCVSSLKRLFELEKNSPSLLDFTIFLQNLKHCAHKWHLRKTNLCRIFLWGHYPLWSLSERLIFHLTLLISAPYNWVDLTEVGGLSGPDLLLLRIDSLAWISPRQGVWGQPGLYT